MTITIFDYMIHEIQSQMEGRTNYIISGKPGDYAEYRYTAGELAAFKRALQIVKMAESKYSGEEEN